MSKGTTKIALALHLMNDLDVKVTDVYLCKLAILKTLMVYVDITHLFKYKISLNLIAFTFCSN